MGYLRKGLFVATGGLSGLVVKANSKKDRAAKAAEKQLALSRRMERAQARAYVDTLHAQPATETPETPEPDGRSFGAVMRDALREGARESAANYETKHGEHDRAAGERHAARMAAIREEHAEKMLAIRERHERVMAAKAARKAGGKASRNG